MDTPNKKTPGVAIKPVGERRRFIKGSFALIIWISGLLSALTVGIVTFLNPLRQKGRAGQFLKLASLDTLPSDGIPLKVPIIEDRIDAWNKFPNEPVGAVYLRKTGNKTVKAFQIVCPHAGCFITFDAKNNEFSCPCHSAHFDLNGKRKDKKSPSPRDLDTLSVDIRNGTEVWVKFQNFQTGITSKIVRT